MIDKTVNEMPVAAVTADEITLAHREEIERSQKNMRSAKLKKRILKAVIYTVLVLYAAIIILPFFIVLITALKNHYDATRIPFQFIPSMGFSFESFQLVFEETTRSGVPTLIQGFLNTLMYVIPPTILGLFTSSLSAYAFAKLRFRAKNIMYTMLLATMMIPGMIMLAPQLAIYDSIRWVDTPLPLMIPGMFGAAACVFFMRQFFTGIPDSLLEAAKIDGLGFLGIFFRIMVPLSVPALLAQGLLGFIGGYNDFMGPLIYLGQKETWTLQLFLYDFPGNYPLDPNVVMAACLVALMPLLILYFTCQKFFINGIVSSGLKD